MENSREENLHLSNADFTMTKNAWKIARMIKLNLKLYIKVIIQAKRYLIKYPNRRKITYFNQIW